MSLSRFFIQGAHPKIPLHGLMAVFDEVIEGQKTAAEAKTLLETIPGVTFDAGETAAFAALFTAITGGASAEIKRTLANQFYRPLILADHGYWYTTEAALDTRMGW